MNIFNVLSTGKSSLREPSMSAMLAYLLNPYQDHGLGKKFIYSFLELANQDNNLYEKYINDVSIKFEIDLEVPYYYNNKRNDIDIQIKILDQRYNELHRIIIENKIRAGAANPNQLYDYYHAVINDKNNDDVFEIESKNLSVIFLTPKVKSKSIEEEFEKLDTSNKVWLYWNSEETGISTVVKLIQKILLQEQSAEISPINEYMRHTLKAFTHYVIETIDIGTGKTRAGEDIGEIKLQTQININNHPYVIKLRDSGQVQLFDENGDKIQARPLLIKFLEENRIPLKGKCSNTRCIGKQIFDYLEKKRNK